MTPPTVQEVRGVRQPSAHLTWDELRCHDAIRTPYPIDWRDTRLPVLAQEFEAVRAALAAAVGRDVPLIVQSAYRTPAYNASIPDAAPGSQHVQGRALDLRPSDPTLVPVLFRVALTRAQSAGRIRGLGRYDTFVHIDTRPAATLKQWDFRKDRSDA